MSIQGRPSITRHSVETSSNRTVSRRAPLASFLLAIGVVAPTTACAVATDDGELTGTVAEAAQRPPGGGIGDRPPVWIPPAINWEQLVEISAGKNHTCVRKLNGKVHCWGSTSYGQAGVANGTCLSGVNCVKVPSFTGITASQVDLGYDQSCVVDSNGQGRCWGANHIGQLGVGPVWITPNYPAGSQAISYNGAPLAVSRISAGSFSGCALTASNAALFCWGDAGPGAYPVGTGVPAPNPINNGGVGISGVASLSTWFAGACIQFALPAGTDNYCFRGADANGNAQLLPSFDSSATRISADSVFACADKANGTVECFGGNLDGELGNGTTTNSSVPVVVGNGMALHGVSAGQYHACALDPAGNALCWGNNWSGGSMSPVAVSAPVTFAALASGDLHTCGIGNDGHIYCWGNNAYGQIGNNSWSNTTLAVTMANDPI